MSDTYLPPWWKRWWGLTLLALGALVVAGLWLGPPEDDQGPLEVAAAADEVEDLPSPTATPTVARRPTPTPASTPTRAPAAGARGDDAPVVLTGVVTNIVDGDTLDLDDGTRVRLAIVDTPEVHGGKEQCGEEASVFARRAVLGEQVSILRPAGAPAFDSFDRRVGEVVRGDGYSLNVALVAAGLARVDERFTGEDPDLAARARAAQDGAAVASCAAVAPPVPASDAAGGEPPPGGDCHPAYRPCVPPAPPDLNCPDVDGPIRVDHGRGDPHGFDRDKDGVGCEG